ncbi:hypothetical protein CSW98_06125 [Vibrio sp. HA2012]|uniref:hypothetical protein n=1 Tax=Vibrio sp. HA2012 TaxID=1971595 RepID=UPI000C2C2962|nr:hypothetical protein [Vibrio sp. HA2012]PJC87468.1 hypothetical protein CSW98_06125 [Vibrio sp. HA2012]
MNKFILALVVWVSLPVMAVDKTFDYKAPLFCNNRQEYLLKHVEDVSRDYFYIQIKDQREGVTLQGFVGGEHQTHYRLLGFAGDHYHVVIEESDGKASASVDGDGLTVSGDDYVMDIGVTGETVWIDIAVSSVTFTSNYMISIEKIQDITPVIYNKIITSYEDNQELQWFLSEHQGERIQLSVQAKWPQVSFDYSSCGPVFWDMKPSQGVTGDRLYQSGTQLCFEPCKGYDSGFQEDSSGYKTYTYDEKTKTVTINGLFYIAGELEMWPENLETIGLAPIPIHTGEVK